MTEMLEELNRDIWRPFVAAYGALDADAFLALTRDDMIHVSGSRGQVDGLDEYGRQMREFFAMVADRGDRVEIAFRFQERIASGGRASERGVFRFTATLADGEVRTRYGRFHTISVRDDGRWRFLVDYDTDDAGASDEFDSAASMDDLAALPS